MYIISVVIT